MPYATIFFKHGDEASALLKGLDRVGPERVMPHAIQYDHAEYNDVADAPEPKPWHVWTHQEGDYILGWSPKFDYVYLEKRIDPFDN
ncbi:MAG: hypothetical protein EOO39_00600 [Cytophagaceae bacterium]|nr:MAG: hypothetical protein EOO39_00600 [Cytophagaceae bacterium]